MPSFDIVSELDWQEVRNGVDQANREIANRFDFKGSDARIEQSEAQLTLHADDEFKIDQVRDILLNKLTKRAIDIACLEEKPVEKAAAGKAADRPRTAAGKAKVAVTRASRESAAARRRAKSAEDEPEG